MTDDPRWPRASAWLAGDAFAGVRDRLTVIGLPIRHGSISGGRFDLAPGAIRKALERFSTYDAELGVDVRRIAVDDRGDLPLADVSPSNETFIGDLIGRLGFGAAVVLLGGDNSITRPGVIALSLGFVGLGDPSAGEPAREPPPEDFVVEVIPDPDPSREERSDGLADPEALSRVGLLTLDAHHDLRDTADGMTNGNPVRALLEDGLPGRNVAQIGIQAFANSLDYAKVAADAGVHVVTADQVRAAGIKVVIREALARLDQVADRIYVDVDLDVLDRAFAPACPGSRPGGLTPGDVQAAVRLCGANPKVRTMDVVEVDPTRDVAEATALAAASIVLSFAAGLAARP